MKPFLILAAFSLSLLSVSSDAMAETYFVSPSGFNNRPAWQARNRATPWRTIQHGVDRAQPGDTIVVLEGQYWEHVRFRRSGTANASITLTSESKWAPEIIGSIGADQLSYLRVLGLRVTNRRADSPVSKGIVFTRCHHVTIRDNEVYRCRGGGISCDQSDSILIEWNVAHHNAFWDVSQHSGISVYQPQRRGPSQGGFGIVIRNNTSYRNSNKVDNPDWGRPTDGNGVVIDDVMNISPGGNGVVYDRGVLIENNLCFLNGGQGVHCYQSQRVYIRNNTCYANMIDFEFGGEVSVSKSKQIFVYNNILLGRHERYAALQFESDQVWWDYNLLNHRPSRDVRHGGHTRNASRQVFEDGSFALHPQSEAIDQGLTHTVVFPWDVYGHGRISGNGIDMGATEYQGIFSASH